MRRGRAVLAVLAVAVATGASAQAPEFPEGEFTAMLNMLEWRPGRMCRVPIASLELRMGRSAGLERAVANWERCVRRQADRDATYAAKRVFEDRDAALKRGYEEMTLDLELMR